MAAIKHLTREQVVKMSFVTNLRTISSLAIATSIAATDSEGVCNLVVEETDTVN